MPGCINIVELHWT